MRDELPLTVTAWADLFQNCGGSAGLLYSLRVLFFQSTIARFAVFGSPLP